MFNLRWTYEAFRNKRFAHNTLEAVSYTPDSRFPVLRTGGFRAPEYPTAKANNLNPYYYFEHLLTEIPKLKEFAAILTATVRPGIKTPGGLYDIKFAQDS